MSNHLEASANPVGPTPKDNIAPAKRLKSSQLTRVSSSSLCKSGGIPFRRNRNRVRGREQVPSQLLGGVAKGLIMVAQRKTAEPTVCNGINVDDLFALIEGVRRDTAKGKTNTVRSWGVSSEARQLSAWEPYDDGRCGHL
jgi:hypothetical protein